MDYDSEVEEIDEESITKDQWDSIKEKKLQKLMGQVSLASSSVQGTMSSKIKMRNEIRSLIMT